MTLLETKVGNDYEVEELKLPKTQEMRLAALGLTKGTKIAVLNKKRRGAVIFNVRGTRLAVGSKIADSIVVSDHSMGKAAKE